MGRVVYLPLRADQDSPVWRRVADASLQYAKNLFPELVSKSTPAHWSQSTATKSR